MKQIKLLKRMSSGKSRLKMATNEVADGNSCDEPADKFAAAETTHVDKEAKAEQHENIDSQEDIMGGHSCSGAVEESNELGSGQENNVSEEASAVEAGEEAKASPPLPKSPHPPDNISEPMESAEENCEDNNTKGYNGYDVTEETKVDQSTTVSRKESTAVEYTEVGMSLPPQSPPKLPENTSEINDAEVGNANEGTESVAATASAKPQTTRTTNTQTKPENLVSFETATSSYDEEALRRRKIGYGVNSKPGSLKNRLAAFEKKQDDQTLPAPPKRKTGKLAVSSIFESGGATAVSPTNKAGKMGGGKLRDRMAAFENKSKAAAPIGPAKSRPIGRVTSNPFVSKDSSTPAEGKKQPAPKYGGVPSKVAATEIPSSEKSEDTSVTDSLAASAEDEKMRRLEDEKLTEKNKLDERDRLEKERLAEEKAEQERQERERQFAEDKERLLQEERHASQLESYAELTIIDDDLQPSRALTEEETERLRGILKAKVESHPRFNLLTDGEDAQDLMDYCFDMISDMESVGHVVSEVEFMGFNCFNEEVSERFRRSLTKFFSDMS